MTPYDLYWQLPRTAIDCGTMYLYSKNKELKDTILVSTIIKVQAGQSERNGLTAVGLIELINIIDVWLINRYIFFSPKIIDERSFLNQKWGPMNF